MKVAICASMVFAERMLEVKAALEKMGHAAFASEFAGGYVGKSENEKEALTLHNKGNNGAIRLFWEKIKQSDAILVLNYERKGIANYIGGNTLMEIGFGHVLGKKIFLLNPVPEIEFYKSEIEAVRPIVINGDLALIK